MKSTLTKGVGADAAAAIAEAGAETEWLKSWRQQAWERYAAQPLPDRVNHLWRYTEPQRFVPDKVNPLLPRAAAGALIAATSDGAGTAQTDYEHTAGTIVVEDSDVRQQYLADEWRQAGVVLTDLRAAVRDHRELIEAHLGSAVTEHSGKFEALNAALFAAGVFLYIPPNLAIAKPFRVLVNSTMDLTAVFPRLLVVVDEGSEATLIEEHHGGIGQADDASPRVIANAVSEGNVGRNARLNYVNLQLWGDRTRSHLKQRMLVERDGSVTTVNLGLGGLYNKADLGNVLVGPNAQAEMIGMIFGGARQHFDSHTEHIHRVRNSYSDMDFKVVLEDRARSAYTGLIRIDVDAPNSEAYQENRNLLLNPECRAESIPELEILNDEVRCTHGATVGPIDEEQVFYLMTRGLSRREAEQAIVEGFFGPALDRVSDNALRERLWSYVTDKLERRG